MVTDLNRIRDKFIESMGRISKFWGFSRLMGQLYGTLYLSSEPMSLDQMTNSLMVSKGSVSTNIRALERWGMVHKVWVKADRKDYYRAETKFMDIMTRILQEREKKEFDSALKTVSECLTETQSLLGSEETEFLKQRLENMQNFFSFIDQSVFSTLYLLKSHLE
ncbi:hypothetical protein HZA56_12545 [Candidatus Poribacteria bacterium]|nr:hypothetical protein [Candidatus Poribacteria bacterium]